MIACPSVRLATTVPASHECDQVFNFNATCKPWTVVPRIMTQANMSQRKQMILVTAVRSRTRNTKLHKPTTRTRTARQNMTTDRVLSTTPVTNMNLDDIQGQRAVTKTQGKQLTTNPLVVETKTIVPGT